MFPEGNSSFSRLLPGLQLAIDSTSLGEFKTCPRRYQFSIIEGWQPREQSVHLSFGIWLHSGRERYERLRFQGQTHDDALDSTLDWLLRATWNKDLGRPWASDHKTKHRPGLIRTLVWYLDEYGADDPLQTIRRADGQPAVELSFRFDSGLVTSSTGEPLVFCGHLDRLAELNGEPYISDLKTTGHTLDAHFFKQFSPDNQMSMYDLAGRVAFHVPVRGLIIDAAQILTDSTRFQRGLVPRTPDQADEWLAETGRWLRRMEQSALDGVWEANDKACGLYGGCQFRDICSRPPRQRETWLEAGFTRRVWDPLVARGDI